MPSSVTYVRPTVNLVRGADCTICTGPLLEAIAVAALDRGATQAPDAQSPRQVAGRSRRSLDRARHTRSEEEEEEEEEEEVVYYQDSGRARGIGSRERIEGEGERR